MDVPTPSQALSYTLAIGMSESFTFFRQEGNCCTVVCYVEVALISVISVVAVGDVGDAHGFCC